MLDAKWDLIEASQVEVIDRARTELGDTASIEESGKRFGQLQNIVVEEQAGEKPYRLLAGERRLKSLPKAGVVKLLAKIYPPLTDEERMSIELTENKARLDMSWQDEARLIEKIHIAQLALKGGTGTSATDGWSQGKTAEMLGMSAGKVNSSLQMTKLLEKVPELKKCKTRREAENILAKMAEQKVLEELSRRAAEAQPKDDLELVRAILGKRYMVGDTFELIQSVADESIDLIDLDPPFAIEYNSAGVAASSARENTTEFNRKDFQEWEGDVYLPYLTKVLEQCYRVLKPNSWLLCWYAQEPWAEDTFQAIKRIGFELKRIPAVWNKNVHDSNVQASAYPDYYLGRSHECFYYARKGSPCINRRARSDVFNYARPAGERTHPTEKPVELMRDVLSTFVPPKSKVLVPFAGSGNSIIAATEVLMDAVGFDLSENYRNGYISKLSNWRPGDSGRNKAAANPAHNGDKDSGAGDDAGDV